MKSPIHLRSTSLAVLALAGATSAQMAEQVPITEAQGQLTNWAVGLSIVDSNVLASSAGAARVRAPGVQNGQPIGWTAAEFGAATAIHPDYSLSALTQNWGFPSLPATTFPDELFGGISTGGDVTPPVTFEGVLQRTPRVWYALNVSVRGDAQGEEDSLIRARAGVQGGAGSEIFSYYPYAGLSLPESFEDTVRVEFTRAQLGITTSTAQVENLDVGMGLISADPGGEAGFFTPVRDRFFFTVTKHALTT